MHKYLSLCVLPLLAACAPEVVPVEKCLTEGLAQPGGDDLCRDEGIATYEVPNDTPDTVEVLVAFDTEDGCPAADVVALSPGQGAVMVDCGLASVLPLYPGERAVFVIPAPFHARIALSPLVVN